MKRNEQHTANDAVPSVAESRLGVLDEWVARLRQRCPLREEWAVGDLQGGIEKAGHLPGRKVVKVGPPADGRQRIPCEFQFSNSVTI